jgi:hypothetical protein
VAANIGTLRSNKDIGFIRQLGRQHPVRRLAGDDLAFHHIYQFCELLVDRHPGGQYCRMVPPGAGGFQADFREPVTRIR